MAIILNKVRCLVFIGVIFLNAGYLLSSQLKNLSGPLTNCLLDLGERNANVKTAVSTIKELIKLLLEGAFSN